MKVLFNVAGLLAIPPVLGGAIEQLVHELYIALTKEKVDVDFAVSRSGQVELVEPSQEAYSWPGDGPSALLCSLTKALTHACRGEYDIIHCFFRKAAKPILALSRTAEIPLVFSEWNHVPWISSEGNGSILAKTLPLLRSSVITTCPSPAMRSGIIRATGMAPDRVRIVPHAVNTSFFRIRDRAKEEVRKRLGLPPEAVLFVHVGRMARHKGFLDAARALSILRSRGYSAYLLQIGPSKARFPDEGAANAVVSIGTRSPDSHYSQRGIVPVGLVTRDRLPSLYSAADALIFPTVAEAFGLVSAESMACETPVIAYDVEPVRWVVGDAGILVESGSVAGLASSMERICEGGDEVARMRKRSRMRVENHFSWPRIANLYLHTYEDAISCAGSHW